MIIVRDTRALSGRIRERGSAYVHVQRVGLYSRERA